jgi:outer membrane protein insertion porin family
MKKLCCVLLLFGSFMRFALAFEPFIVKDIRVEGLQRISAGTVFNYLPVKVGEKFDEQVSAQAVRALYKTGFFKDVRLERNGDVLVVIVQERPSISSIDVKGNKSIPKDQLMEGLKRVGLAEGRVFNRSLLDKIEQELQRQYFSEGKYAVKIDTKVTPLERNRVAIALDISEGRAAKIREINIVGNKVFTNKRLLDMFTLSTPTTFSFYTRNDQYSKQKLAGDLEKLRSFYLDNGYLNFKIDSTQVSISPDKKYVYITINITEGPQYKVKDVKLAGNLVLPAEELEKLIQVKAGSIYSQKLVAESTSKITARLGDEGYAFANVNTVPDIDEKAKEVSLTLFVDPGKRVYVRRINFTGNVRTSDEVLRREMRQMEGGWFSTEKVNRSRSRLEKLGFFTEVNVETPAVPGTTDQVDVNFTVVEKPSGNLLASVGYSQTDGFIFSGSIEQDNFLGTGKRVSARVSTSQVNRGFSVAYTNPYYTIDGVSRGFLIASQRTDASQANLSYYIRDTDQLSVFYGIPINEYDRISLSLGVRRDRLRTTDQSAQEIIDFVKTGDTFVTIPVGVGWSHDTRNRAFFPDRGAINSISGEIAMPGGDLEYYKASIRHQDYIPLGNRLTLSFHGEVAYGDGYGDTTSLPFYENYFAGGTRSVRGFKDNTLGPRDSNGNPLGGSFKVVGGAEAFFPGLIGESKQVQVGAFIDIGNVYRTPRDFNRSDSSSGPLRYSAGISTLWLSPIGPLNLSFARPLNKQDGDQTQPFQFTLGGSFF